MKCEITFTSTPTVAKDRLDLESYGFKFTKEDWGGWDKGETRGFINFKSLKDLVNFANRWGPLVVESVANKLEIEIYNDYRE